MTDESSPYTDHIDFEFTLLILVEPELELTTLGFTALAIHENFRCLTGKQGFSAEKRRHLTCSQMKSDTNLAKFIFKFKLLSRIVSFATKRRR